MGVYHVVAAFWHQSSGRVSDPWLRGSSMEMLLQLMREYLVQVIPGGHFESRSRIPSAAPCNVMRAAAKIASTEESLFKERRFQRHLFLKPFRERCVYFRRLLCKGGGAWQVAKPMQLHGHPYKLSPVGLPKWLIS
eukprot:796185-Amphidinium_carterae.1